MTILRPGWASGPSERIPRVRLAIVVPLVAIGFTVVCADGRFKVTRVQADGPKIAGGEFAANAKLNPGVRFS